MKQKNTFACKSQSTARLETGASFPPTRQAAKQLSHQLLPPQCTEAGRGFGSRGRAGFQTPRRGMMVFILIWDDGFQSLASPAVPNSFLSYHLN